MPSALLIFFAITYSLIENMLVVFGVVKYIT